MTVIGSKSLAKKIKLPKTRSTIIEYRVFDHMRGIDFETLDDDLLLHRAVVGAARMAGMTCENLDIHYYHPQGKSVTLIVSASHIGIHTYPEKGFASVEIAVCKDFAGALKAYEYIRDILKPKYCEPNYHQVEDEKR